jgi:DNA-binding phage protein
MNSALKKAEVRDDRIMGLMEKMSQEGLPNSFVLDLCNLARKSNSILGLMELWSGETDQEERAEIIADLQDHIDDDRDLPRNGDPVEAPKISFSNLDAVVGDIAGFKAKLRDLIDRHGGIVAVATKAGIPQPSLSRLLNSGSMPRRSTLYKIANVLNLSETEIAGEWVR